MISSPYDHARLINVGQGNKGESMTLVFEIDEPYLWFFHRMRTFQVIGDGSNWRFVGGRPCTGMFRERLRSIWQGLKEMEHGKDQVERHDRV